MTPERSSLEGFELSPNSSAWVIEKHLGLIYPDIAPVIVLQGANCEVLRQTYPDLSEFREVYGISICYHIQSGVIFTDKLPQDNIGYLVEMHENMHHYNYRRSLKLAQGNITKLNEIAMQHLSNYGGIGSKSSTLLHPDYQRYVVYQSVDEGIAYWGSTEAITAAIKSTDSDSEEDKQTMVRDIALQRHACKLLPKDRTEKVCASLDFNIDEAYVDQQFKALVFVCGCFRQAFDGSIDDFRKNYNMASGLLFDLNIAPGLYFTEKAIAELQDQGLTTADSINWILTNPPSKIDQLRNPVDYVKKYLQPKLSPLPEESRNIQA